MPESLNYPEAAFHAPERRKSARVPVRSIAYVELDRENGGLILDLSECGLGVRAAEAIAETAFPKMRFCLPESSKWIEASARLAWVGTSRKEAGIEFVDLSDDDREQIRNWMSFTEHSPKVAEDADSAGSIPERENLSPASAEAGERSIPPEFESMFPSEAASSTSGTASEKVNFHVRTSSRKKWSLGVGQAQGAETASESAEPVEPVGPSRSADGPPYFSNRSASRPTTSPNAELDVDVELLRFRTAAPSPHPTPNETPALQGGATSTVPGERPIALTGFGYQPAEFEEPWGKGWILVAVALIGLLCMGAVLAIGPANVKDLLTRRNTDGIQGPPPPQNATGKTPATPGAPAPSVQTEARAQKPAPPPDGQMQTRDAGPKAIITDPGSAPIPHESQDSGVSGSPALDVEDPEAVTHRFQQQHAQSYPSAPNISQTGANTGTGFQQQRTAPVESVATKPPPILPSGTPSPVAPSPVPQAALPTGTVAVQSHFHSIWGSDLPPSPNDGPLQIGQLESMSQPVYPEEAERAHEEGVVVLRAIVDTAGAVEIVQLVSGPPILAPAAINAVRAWRYGPTFQRGRAVESVEDISVAFRLANSAASPR